jgi:ribosomal protein S18 acetylase RimI-like enzyme
MAITVTRGAGPDPLAVRDLYRRASAPLGERPTVADVYAQVYRSSVAHAVVVAATVEDELVGLAYGTPWRWAEERYPWAVELHERLGDAAGRIEGAFAVTLLAVLPEHGGQGLGSRLLTILLDEGGAPTAWLATTDAETTAMRLYRRLGWHRLGHGPDAPDGRPAAILYREQASE